MVLIITGHMRSGTSILMKLCHAHPQITLTNESSVFQFVGYSFPGYCRSMINRWYYSHRSVSFDMTANHRPKWVRLANLGFTIRLLSAIAQQRQKTITFEGIEAALRNIYPESLIVGDKWPLYMRRLPLLTSYSGLQTLVIYRDCRDVVSSLLQNVRTIWQNRWWVPSMDTAEKIASRWVKAIAKMENYSAFVHTIRYEDLVCEPRKTMNAVGQWLDIDPQFFPADWANPQSVGKYKAGLTPAELETIMRIAGPTMARFDYV